MYILVVEDDAEVAKLLTIGLRDAGHVVDFVGNGADGLELATKKHFDVMVLDRMLPGGVDGAAILTSLRDRGINTPALFLSGLGQLSDWVRGLQAGGDDYLVKPASLDEIIRHVEALHQQQTENPPDAKSVLQAD